MKTISKYLTIFLLIAALLCVCFGFVACGSDDDDKKDDGTVETLPDDDEPEQVEGQVTYRFEAEYTDMTYDEFILGSGQSNTVQSWQGQLDANEKASGGAAICNTWIAYFNIRFIVEASEACTAHLTIGVGNNNPSEGYIAEDILEVEVNGEVISYSANVTLPKLSGSASADYDIYAVDIGDIELEEGENVIFLTVLRNELYNGMSWGPCFDYIDLRVPEDVVLDFGEGGTNGLTTMFGEENAYIVG